MRRSLPLLLVLLFTAEASLRASCGSSSCPLDLNALNLPETRRVSLDLSLQYVDQDQPRIGTRNARVGEIPGEHHDEVRTVNRISTLALTYAATSRLHLVASLPFISRDHQHLASSHEHITSQHNNVPESWDIRGIGDLSLLARAEVVEGNRTTRSGLWLIGGVKLPTGAHEVRNVDGEAGELPIQPGSGTIDGIAGLSWNGGVIRRSGAHGGMGDFAVVPYFLSATYQFRGSRDDYRLGNELQLNAGGAYPLGRHLEALLQLNARVRERDSGDPEETGMTGGTYAYASPGLRWSFRGAALYGIVQLPVYQNVNALQLTSTSNYVIGVQTRF